MSEQQDRWIGLRGGYRQPYDPRPAISKLKTGQDVEASWAELWNELHHQGDVGEASYAAVVELASLTDGLSAVDWNVYALATTIEIARSNLSNPPMPTSLKSDYVEAWQRLFASALRLLPDASDENLINSAIAVLALQKGQPGLARLSLSAESERNELLDETGWA